MAPTSRCVVIFTCITGIFAQDRQLQEQLKHGGVESEDCFDNCWKTAGSCLWCGGGNACCNLDGTSSDPMCTGVSFVGMTGTGWTGHRCVKATLLPGQTAPLPGFRDKSGALVSNQMPAATKITDESKAQCIGYLAETKGGCGWTAQHSCPGQPQGIIGLAGITAADRSTRGYKCCCTDGLWQEEAIPANHGGNPLIDQGQCQTYMQTTGCGWTAKYNCEGQRPGSMGKANDDRNPITNAGGQGYGCCCRNGMWKTGGTSWHANSNGNNLVHAEGQDPNAFNVASNSGMADNNVFQNGQGVQMTNFTGQGNTKDGGFFFNHQGPNLHIHTYKQTDPNFVPTLHHGPIYDKFTKNNAKARKERCVAGVCAPLLGQNPGDENNLPETQAKMPVLVATENQAKELPSVVMSMGDGDAAPHMTAVTKPAAPTVSTSSTKAVAPGETVMHGSTAGFHVGHQVDIDLGTATHEVNTIVSFGSFTFATPLKFPHPAGAVISEAKTCDFTSPPTNGAIGTCTGTVASGSTCQPTCNLGYTPSGSSSCSITGTLTAATCNKASTTSTAAVAAGATVMQVKSTAGFKVGGTVDIDLGTATHEVNTIKSFGSLDFANPLKFAHAVGAVISEAAAPVAPPPVAAKMAAPVAPVVPVVPAPVAAVTPVTPVAPVTPAPVAAKKGSSAKSSGSSSLSTSSAGYGWVVCLVLAVCCLCLTLGGVAALIVTNKNKKKRSTTDREQNLKDDFIERQPVYHEVAEADQEVEPMMREKEQYPDVNNDDMYNQAGSTTSTEAVAAGATVMQVRSNACFQVGDAVLIGNGTANQEGNVIRAFGSLVFTNPLQCAHPAGTKVEQAPPMQPTQSFPIQTVELVAPVTSFPGLPTIGGNSLMQQTFAAPATAYTYAQPQAASMMASQPYGNYTSPSTYVQQPSMYSAAQPSMYSQYPGGGVV